MKSELRNKIEEAHSQLVCLTRDDGSKRDAVAVDALQATLAAALGELDAMAERDALWGKMDRLRDGQVKLGYNDGMGWRAIYGKEWLACHDTPLAAVQALVEKIEEKT